MHFLQSVGPRFGLVLVVIKGICHESYNKDMERHCPNPKNKRNFRLFVMSRTNSYMISVSTFIHRCYKALFVSHIKYKKCPLGRPNY